MRTMPYNLEGKGVVEGSGFISQISSSVSVSTPVAVSQKWKNKKIHHQHQPRPPPSPQAVGGEEKKSSGKKIPASPTDSEPTSTLDTTRRSPSPPTSTSTLSSFNNNDNINNSDNTAAGVAYPRKADWTSDLQGSDNVTVTATAATSEGERLGVGGLDDWDTMFPAGDGALLPWIIGDPEDPSLGLKHLLQSSGVDYEGNAGLGVVDQAPASSFDTPTPTHSQTSPPLLPLPLPLEGNSHDGAAFRGSDFGTNAKMTAFLSPNSSSAGMLNNSKICTNGFNSSNCLLLDANFPHQLEVGDEKPQIFDPHMVMNLHQSHSLANPSLLMPSLGYCQLEQHLLQPPSKRHNPGLVLDSKNHPFLEQGHELLLRKQQQHFGLQQLPLGLPPQLVLPHLHQKPIMVPKQNQQQHHFALPVLQHQQQQLQEQVLKDQLLKAADLILTGNFSLAQEILARLNHQLSLPAKPLIRAALYAKDALQMLLLMGNPVAAPPPKALTPYDVVHKMNAYKVFSEVSPITQFVNFTCTQAILEALDDVDAIHIIDFDIGCGAQWASFIQELPLRKRGAPSLKLTALAPLSTTHPFELGLIRENLVQFAKDIGLAFELQVVNLDSFDPSSYSMPNFGTSENEAIAVSIPIWTSSNRPSIFPPILEFIKQLSPQIVVSFDRGFDRCDVPFPQHLVHALDSCTNILESLDGLNVASDVVNKIEKFFVQPSIENTLLGRVHFPDKMPHWRNLFNSAGFSPVQFSNFTETQADYVVKKTPGRGFNVEKRQASLVLSWQRRELVAASAWRS